MTQEDIQLLFNDLCGRLPYGVKVTFAGYSGREDCILNSQHLNSTYAIEYLRLRPYLRPLSSMTEEEWRECVNLGIGDEFEDSYGEHRHLLPSHRLYDWLNKHHFDYRGLIQKGLAISTEKFNPYNRKQ